MTLTPTPISFTPCTANYCPFPFPSFQVDATEAQNAVLTANAAKGLPTANAVKGRNSTSSPGMN